MVIDGVFDEDEVGAMIENIALKPEGGEIRRGAPEK